MYLEEAGLITCMFKREYKILLTYGMAGLFCISYHFTCWTPSLHVGHLICFKVNTHQILKLAEIEIQGLVSSCRKFMVQLASYRSREWATSCSDQGDVTIRDLRN